MLTRLEFISALTEQRLPSKERVFLKTDKDQWTRRQWLRIKESSEEPRLGRRLAASNAKPRTPGRFSPQNWRKKKSAASVFAAVVSRARHVQHAEAESPNETPGYTSAVPSPEQIVSKPSSADLSAITPEPNADAPALEINEELNKDAAGVEMAASANLARMRRVRRVRQTSRECSE